MRCIAFIIFLFCATAHAAPQLPPIPDMPDVGGVNQAGNFRAQTYELLRVLKEHANMEFDDTELKCLIASLGQSVVEELVRYSVNVLRGIYGDDAAVMLPAEKGKAYFGLRKDVPIEASTRLGKLRSAHEAFQRLGQDNCKGGGNAKVNATKKWLCANPGKVRSTFVVGRGEVPTPLLQPADLTAGIITAIVIFLAPETWPVFMRTATTY